MFGNRKFDIKMVCFLIGPIPMPARSEEILPSPKMKGLKRDRRTAVPISPAAGLATSRQELRNAGQQKPFFPPERKRDPYFSQQDSTEKYAVKKVIRSKVRNGSKGCLSVADKLPGNTFKENKKLNVTSLSQLMKGKVWNNTAGTFLQEPMSSNTMQKDIVKVGEVRRRVQDAMGDFDVTDREMWADSQVNRKLRKIWKRFVKYRNHVQNLNRKYEVVLMFTKKVSFDDDVGRLHDDIKKHAVKMREFAEQIYPVEAIKKVPEDVCYVSPSV